jgi:hypothetical protein
VVLVRRVKREMDIETTKTTEARYYYETGFFLGDAT